MALRCNRGDSDDRDDILLCDFAGCFRSYHQNCLSPPITPSAFPDQEEDWFCWQCECLMDCLETLEDEFPVRHAHSADSCCSSKHGGTFFGAPFFFFLREACTSIFCASIRRGVFVDPFFFVSGGRNQDRVVEEKKNNRKRPSATIPLLFGVLGVLKETPTSARRGLPQTILCTTRRSTTLPLR